jgi:hypothetical protein
VGFCNSVSTKQYTLVTCNVLNSKFLKILNSKFLKIMYSYKMRSLFCDALWIPDYMASNIRLTGWTVNRKDLQWKSTGLIEIYPPCLFGEAAGDHENL